MFLRSNLVSLTTPSTGNGKSMIFLDKRLHLNNVLVMVKQVIMMMNVVKIKFDALLGFFIIFVK